MGRLSELFIYFLSIFFRMGMVRLRREIGEETIATIDTGNSASPQLSRSSLRLLTSG